MKVVNDIQHDSSKKQGDDHSWKLERRWQQPQTPFRWPYSVAAAAVSLSSSLRRRKSHWSWHWKMSQPGYCCCYLVRWNWSVVLHGWHYWVGPSLLTGRCPTHLHYSRKRPFKRLFSQNNQIYWFIGRWDMEFSTRFTQIFFYLS